jgi:hypothetical protein
VIVKFFFGDTNRTDFESEAEENAKILVRRVKTIFEHGKWVMMKDVGVTRDALNGHLLLFYKIENTGSCCGFCSTLPVSITDAPIGAPVMDATVGIKLCWKDNGVLVPVNEFA